MRPSDVAGCSGRARPGGRWLRETQNLDPIAVGHRVVHGGPEYDRPVLVDETVLAAARTLRFAGTACTSPTISPRSARILARRPDLPQVACFDTAFHRGHGARRGPLRDPASTSTRRACAATASTACRTSMSPSRLRAGCARYRGGQGDRCASGQRRVHVRALRWPQHREHDGLYRPRRVADGHAAGPDRSRRRALPDRGKGDDRGTGRDCSITSAD